MLSTAITWVKTVVRDLLAFGKWKHALEEKRTISQLASDLTDRGWEVVQIDTWGYAYAAATEEHDSLLLVLIRPTSLSHPAHPYCGPYVTCGDLFGMVSSVEPSKMRLRDRCRISGISPAIIAVTTGWSDTPFRLYEEDAPGITMVEDVDNLLILLRDRQLLN